MDFPKSIKDLKQRISLKLACASATGEEVERLKKIQKNNQEIASILNGLLNSWREPDPGKYRDVFFFLDSSLYRRVVVREFLTKGIKICRDRREWDRYNEGRSWHGADYDRVPYWYPIVNLSDVGKDKCAKCKSPQPVIEHYTQTEDTPEGDTWLKKQFVLCLECDLITVVKSNTSDSRF